MKEALPITRPRSALEKALGSWPPLPRTPAQKNAARSMSPEKGTSYDFTGNRRRPSK